jgi:uncharacterized membrane protein YhaH (DUF805 family)
MTIPTLPARPATDDQPLYGATFGQAFTRFWQRYALFYGRASRSEFWWWFLVNVLVGGALSALSGNGTNHSNTFFSILSALWSLATLVPNLALSTRRLHDTNRSGFWIFLALIPVVGGIILIVWCAGQTNPYGARFDRANAGGPQYPQPPYPPFPTYPSSNQPPAPPAAPGPPAAPSEPGGAGA